MTGATPLAAYMKKGEAKAERPASGFLEMARKFELSGQSTEDLKAYAEAIGIEFLSSPFDVPSVPYLKSIGVKRLKLPSGELVNPLLLEAAAATKLPLIVSTGMATLEEVRYAVELLKRNGSGPLCLLHCLTQYPAEFRHVNLRAMLTLAKEFPG
jgi:sialic acid synthase SpsE